MKCSHSVLIGANTWQVLDERGARIEPAFTKFREAMSSPEAGDEPGVVWYHEIEESNGCAK